MVNIFLTQKFVSLEKFEILINPNKPGNVFNGVGRRKFLSFQIKFEQ